MNKLPLIALAVCLAVMPLFPAVAGRPVDINAASLTGLETLTGIGPVKAQAIINARPFSSVDDLLKVKGIGEKTLEKIKQQGLACVNCQTSQLPTADSQISPATANATTAETTETAPTQKPPEGSSLETTPLEIVPERTPLETIAYPKNVFINEVMPSPSGSDEENEWVELFNANNFDVSLAGWSLRDTVGSIKTFVFPDNTEIKANGFLVLTRPQTKIVLQNSGDGLELLDPNGQIAGKTEYGKASQGQSWNRLGQNHVWSSTPTPGAQNLAGPAIPGLNQVKSMTGYPATNALSNIAQTAEDLTANINAKTPFSKNPDRILELAVGIAIAAGSAIVVIILKQKTKPTNAQKIDF
ncbi:MAG: lamin tail domain-containing protein [Patescibacteria group bacterium]|nr:lamin tail domain-containing protein [Patescibacteria group bacterium]